jgi:ABC-type lipoprotein export system ATPase subunit
MVTHEPEIASHCKRVVRMQDGRLAQDYRNHHHSHRN